MTFLAKKKGIYKNCLLSRHSDGLRVNSTVVFLISLCKNIFFEKFPLKAGTLFHTARVPLPEYCPRANSAQKSGMPQMNNIIK